MRRRLPWLLCLPLMTAGSLAAHGVGRLIYPGGAGEAVEAGEPAPFRIMPVVAGLGAIALVVALAWLWSRWNRRVWRGATPGWFLILPIVAYAAGEAVERLFPGAGAVMHEARDANLMLGILLQLPFAAVAYALARVMLVVARAVVAALRRSAPRARVLGERRPVPPRLAPVRRSLHTVARSVRGPPPLTV